MTTLDFSDAEPTLTRTSTADNSTFAGNASIYQRLQGQTKKKGIDRYGWVALPVAAVAIVGVVAATSMPHRSADNVAAGPAGAKPASVAAASPTSTASPAQIHAQVAAAPAEQQPKAAPAPVRTAQSSPAPIQAPRRAVSSQGSDVRPASATQPQSVPAASVLTPAPDAAPPAAAAPPPEVPAPSVPAPSVSAPSASTPAPADSAPVVTAPAPASTDAAPAQ